MRRMKSLLLIVFLLLTLNFNAFAAQTDLYIRHIYGGGDKGDTPISNSFIEIFNPTDKDILLSSYLVKYDDQDLKLEGIIPAHGSYLITGLAEQTSDDFLTYDLPQADISCSWSINNKSYTIELAKGDEIIDSVTAGNTDASKISKQKSLKQDEDDNLKLVLWKKEDVSVTASYVDANAPRNSKGEYGNVHGEIATQVVAEEEYTPVQASDVRVNGLYNQAFGLNLELVARYNSGAMNADGGSLEIVSYNPVNGFAYAVSGVKGKVIAINLNENINGERVKELSGTEYDVKALIEGFKYGDITSVAVSPDGKALAVAIQAENYNDSGVAALFSCAQDGSLSLISTAKVGIQPDMITFADNNTILTADEGEPREGLGNADPKGSVSIIKVSQDKSLSVDTVYFDKFDNMRDELINKSVLIQKDKMPSEDFEPEYISVVDNTAYISLQEANAIAVLDIEKSEFTNIYPLGFQDYSKTKIDLQKNDTIEIENYDNVYSIKMPDGIATAKIGGKTYLLSANEGDSRSDWAGYDNEYENSKSPSGNVSLDKKVVWFNSSLWDGLDNDKAYIFGGRSFSIYEVTDNALKLIYDSGSSFEEVTAEKLPAYFNTSNDKNSIDNRSGKKGPEPESVVTGVISDKTFAFIALERIGGIMAYDITNPSEVKFANYINSREFESAIQGDVSPEGLFFISAENSKTGKPLLLAACEVSGTLAVYECDYKKELIEEVKPEITPSEQIVNSTPTQSTNSSVVPIIAIVVIAAAICGIIVIYKKRKSSK